MQSWIQVYSPMVLQLRYDFVNAFDAFHDGNMDDLGVLVGETADPQTDRW